MKTIAEVKDQHIKNDLNIINESDEKAKIIAFGNDHYNDGELRVVFKFENGSIGSELKSDMTEYKVAE